MKNKNIVVVIVVAVVAAGAGFFGGMKYTAGQGNGNSRSGGFANLTPEQRQARFGQFGGGGRGNRAAGGFANGSVLSKDDKSVTIKLNDGSGSKIIFTSASTQVMKAVSGSVADVVVGGQISAMGTPNADGSLNAETIQIRPNTPPGDRSATTTK